MHTHTGLAPEPCSTHGTTSPDGAALSPADSKRAGPTAAAGASPAPLHAVSFHPALTFAHLISVSTGNPIGTHQLLPSGLLRKPACREKGHALETHVELELRARTCAEGWGFR